MASLDHIVTLNIPFETAKQAQIARDTIAVDPVLKKDEISVDYITEGATLVARFAGVSDRVIRVAVSNSIDNIKTIIETIDEFDGENDTVFPK
ncbi:transcription factor Pcc1 [Metschnikowia bicuspidata var. bicuspidata NRRL YB-4993]|uniref:Transcription factor Pcc1 n=1 Tax=Metschnikowia bicuspidata var. bicuspidata NRRL YB-4993 TaxID=869754 RepID=A0A1A0HB96_9ASCO|nr:transcription factor Pcc1 [Metschnikowia bicuspidata var. bicuspidata NRRL YB-4993]OBA21260.1 transcription factor Pcc1 [Metschnikowia bicuspidata var. bicuspidata NRRL YB-4993]